MPHPYQDPIKMPHEREAEAKLPGCDAAVPTRTDQFGRKFVRRCGVLNARWTRQPNGQEMVRCPAHNTREWLQAEGA